MYRALAILFTLFFTAVSYAQGGNFRDLTLIVSGSIPSAPQWRNFGNTAISIAEFDFSENVAGDPTRNIDSAEIQIRLFNAVTYPATVSMVRPSSCKIGATSVANSHVYFVHNGLAIATDSEIDFPNDTLQAIRIRFSSTGNYGDKAGQVSCDSGALIYSY